MSRIKTVARAARIPILLLMLVLVAPLLWIGIECGSFGSVEPNAEPISGLPVSDSREEPRPEEQTYLTFPEWYIVYSADEYASFVQQHPASQFPYFRSISQYWSSYGDICAITHDKYPFNLQYHGMLYVIGMSFSLENAFKGIYEKSFGRITEWFSAGENTEEDLFAQAVAKEYGDFLHTIPWYEFPFTSKLRGLWASTSLWGPYPLRKWERKMVLTFEYGGKAIYARIINQGNQASGAPAALEIQATAEGITDEVLAGEPALHLIKRLDAQSAIVQMPRYEAFTQLVPGLTEQGVRFTRIAGNDNIMLTVFAPRDWAFDLTNGELLFAMEILTHPDLQRVALNVPVQSLHTVLAELVDRGIEIEHIYDY